MAEDVETVSVLYSRAGDLYYVEKLDMNRPRCWVSVMTGADGKFSVYPFVFYEVKSGERATLPIDHEMVQRYIAASDWPERGSSRWVEEHVRVLGNLKASLADEEKRVAWYRNEVAKAESLLQTYGPKEA